MHWRTWRSHFEHNARRPLPPPGEEVERGLCSAWRRALVHSLARFQVGESGEGRIAHEVERARLRGVDEDYRAALRLFVREERRHAHILGVHVRRLGGRLLARSWTERLFVFGRRLLGLRLKLLVLLCAEVVGIAFYGRLASRLPPGALRGALEELCRDEEAHLRFHADFFRLQAHTPARRLLLRLAFWPLLALAAGAVLLDHRRTLRTLGLSTRELLASLGEHAWAADARATAPHALPPLAHAAG